MTENRPDTLDGSGLWLTISELATAKGLGRSAVSERVLRLEDQGLLTTRPGKGKTKLVNLAQYDRLIGQVANLAREQSAATKRGGNAEPMGASAVYTREQARRMAYQAEIARLDLDERLGKLVAIDTLRPAIEAAVRASVNVIERLTQDADDLAAAYEGGQITALERKLKAIATRMRTELAEAIVSAAPRTPTRIESTTEVGE